jgi:lysozyme family protein
MKDQGLEDAKTMMQMAATAAAIYGASDRRLKDNIEPIGKLFDGQNVYRYNFKGDDKKQIGLMAQEVEKRYPDAVGLAPRKGYEVGGPATEESRPTSPFDRAVNRTFGFEGGLNPRDSNGAPSNFGINQAANPDVNVRELTQDQAREIYRTRYWDRIGGDALAAQNPDLAHVAFDSAVIAGPNRTRQWLEQANGDVNRLLALREQHETELLRNDPDRFGPYRNAWASRRAGLAGDVNAGESATAGTLAGIGYPTQPRGGLEPRPGSMQERQQDWFGRNESWIMPLVTGLGTMASSPSRYLGSAVLQGLMGAGQAAQQQIGVAGQREKTEQDIKKSRAEEFQSLMQTEAVRAGIGSKSYDPRTNRWTVYNDRGEIISVSMAEYLEASRRGRPFRNAPGPSAREPFTPAEVTQPPLEAGPQRPATLPGQAQPAAAAAPSAPAVTRENLPPLPGQEGEAPPADQNAPMVSEPQEGQAAPATPGRLPPDQQTNLINRAAANVNSNPAIYSSLAQDQNFQDELNQRSQYLTNNASRLSARLPSASENPWNAIAEKADAAESTRVNRDNLANLFANLPVTGFTATGPIQQRITAPFVAGLNSILSALGFSGGINQSDVADRQAIDKALAALSTRAAAENNQRAVSAIDIVKSGIASGAMDQRAIGNAMAGMYVDAQRDIDRNNYASLWRRELEQKLGAGQEYLADYGGRDLSAAFDRRMANSYTREKTYLENLFQQTYRGEDGRYRNQPVWKVLSTSGGQPPRDLIAEMVNRYGDTGYRLLRYFNVTL